MTRRQLGATGATRIRHNRVEREERHRGREWRPSAFSIKQRFADLAPERCPPCLARRDRLARARVGVESEARRASVAARKLG